MCPSGCAVLFQHCGMISGATNGHRGNFPNPMMSYPNPTTRTFGFAVLIALKILDTPTFTFARSSSVQTSIVLFVPVVGSICSAQKGRSVFFLNVGYVVSSSSEIEKKGKNNELTLDCVVASE